MKVLDRYICQEFLKIFCIAILSLISLYLIIDIFEKVDDLLERSVPFSISARIFLYKLPYIFYKLSPVAVLLATLLLADMFVRHNEFTAIKAGGISIIRCMLPLIICAFIITSFNLLLNETITPITNKQSNLIKRKWISGISSNVFSEDSLWHRDSGVIYSIAYIDKKALAARGFTMYSVDSSFQPRAILRADEIVRKGGVWLVTSGILWRFKEDGSIKAESIHHKPLESIGGPSELIMEEANLEEMGYTELQGYITRLRRDGYAPGRYMVDLYSRISFPFVNIIMILIGLPFPLIRGINRNRMSTSIAATLLIGFSYWIVSAINISLGHNGFLPPLFSAWFTNIIFTAIGLLMLSHIKL